MQCKSQELQVCLNLDKSVIFSMVDKVTARKFYELILQNGMLM